mgnify:CR=1 FL=1
MNTETLQLAVSRVFDEGRISFCFTGSAASAGNQDRGVSARMSLRTGSRTCEAPA